jgi:hypothetical protein
VQRWRLIVMGHYKSTILQRAHRRRAFSNLQWVGNKRPLGEFVLAFLRPFASNKITS